MDSYFASDFYGNFILQRDDIDASEQMRRDAALDDALSCTFPASDPIALNFDFVPFPQPDREWTV